MRFESDTSIGGPVGRFPATRPSMIALAAGDDHDRRQHAIDAIAAVYWKPVYKYIRLQLRQSNEDAKDLTQTFIADLVTGDLIARFDPSRASFRTYLRLCVDGFVGHARESASRLKRGGGATMVPIDVEVVERELASESGGTPEDIFHREWQRQMFALGVEDLRQVARDAGKQTSFAIFEAHDLADEPPSYARLADDFGVTVATVTNHLAWARRELRRLVLARVESLTASPAEFAREVRGLFGGPR